MKSIRYWIINFLWSFKIIRRNYCWADAVMWAENPSVSDLFGKADHKCFYCFMCNTKEEIAEYPTDPLKTRIWSWEHDIFEIKQIARAALEVKHE